MRIGFVVNSVTGEDPAYTTIRLAMAATNRGHDVFLIGVDGFAHDPDGSVRARAGAPPGRRYRSQESFLEKIQGAEALERISVADLDVLMLRNDPAEDAVERPWAQTSGILFGQLAAREGVLVLNDPVHLASAINKTYFQHFPEEARPRTLITRDDEEVKAFIDEMGGKAVLKPLQGSGGQGVFLVGEGEAPNVNQIIESITRDGYLVAQEYLPAAKKGDVRVFVMNGFPLERDNEFAAFRRVNRSGDMRSNMHAGGKAEPVKMTDGIRHLVDMVRPKLVQGGMFLVGLDVVGDSLMEVNVFSPGGLGSVSELTRVDFASVVIEAIEHKIDLRRRYGSSLDNVTLATM